MGESTGIHGVTIEDQWEVRRRKGIENWQHGLRFLGKALIPGTKRYKSKGFDSIRDATAWAETARTRMAGGLAPTVNCRVDLYQEEYLANLSAKGASPFYCRQAQVMFDAMAYIGAKDVSDRGFPVKIEEWLNQLMVQTEAGGVVRRRVSKPLSNATKNRYLTQVKAFTRYCFVRGYCGRDVMVGVKKYKEAKMVKKTFTIEQLQLLLSDRFRDQEFWLPVTLMLMAGLRIGEAMHLEWSDILFAQMRIQVRLKPDLYRLKNARERTVVMQPELLAILKPMAQTAGFVVPDRIRKVKPTWGYWFKKLIKAVGIPVDDGLSAHSCRHTYISLMIAAGTDIFWVSRQVGHGNILVTQGYAGNADAYRDAVESWPEKKRFYLRSSF